MMPDLDRPDGARIHHFTQGTERYEEIEDAAHGVTIRKAEQIDALLEAHFASCA